MRGQRCERSIGAPVPSGNPSGSAVHVGRSYFEIIPSLRKPAFRSHKKKKREVGVGVKFTMWIKFL